MTDVPSSSVIQAQLGSLSSHPRDVLLGTQAGTIHLPVCDHYSGTPERMRKSLQLQAEMTAEFGTCVFDVTLDCEDGAPVGGEAEHAALVAQLVDGAPPEARVAVRVHPVNHPAFAQDIATIAGQAGHRLQHIMIPKVESLQDVFLVEKVLESTPGAHLPLQVLIESPLAVHHAFEIAAHPRVQSLSFGLMDFVSAHGGAIPAQAMTAQGQFSHPLVLRAKLAIASACHAHGKVPSHCVVTEFANTTLLAAAVHQASRELGYTRMWSIHPAQIRTIVQAFAPDAQDVEIATEIIAAAADSDWAPIRFGSQLHDRASYRYHWQVLERAHRTGAALAAPVAPYFS